MAPSAITVTLSTTASKPAVGRTFGNYKEQAAGAQAYNKKLEEEGDAHHAKANVCLKCVPQRLASELRPSPSI